MRTASRALRIGAVLAVVAALAVGLAPVAQAADNGSWSVQPTSPKSVTPRQYFIFSAPAGGVIHDSVTIKNESAVSQHFKVYGADAYTTEAQGSFGIASRDETPKAVGAWITVSRPDVTLRPKQSLEVPFTVRVPAGTAPGDHAGAIVALNTKITQGEGTGAQVGVQHAVAARVYARVQGPTNPGLTVSKIWIDRSGKHPTVRYVLQNTGNIRLEPQGKVTVTGIFGRTVRKLPPTDLGVLLPGAHSEYSAELTSLPPVGYLTAHVAATAPEAGASAQAHFWLVPWWLIVGLAIALLLLVGLAVRRWLRRRRRPGDASDESPTAPTDLEVTA